MDTIFSHPNQAGAHDNVSLSELGIAALDYVNKGWHVFPCLPDSKEPHGRLAKHGIHNATTDTQQVASWWTAEPNANIGVYLRPSGLVVVDLDTYKGETAANLGELPATLQQISARGGQHAVYAADPELRYARPRGAQNVDIKHRGYILVAPSRFEGKAYQWANDARPTPAPEWLVRKPIDRSQSTGTTNRTLAEAEDALRYIDPDVPYDQYLNTIMALHAEFDVDGLALIEEWQQRSTDPSHSHRLDQLEYKFGSFQNSDDGITIAYLFKEAERNGCDLSKLAAKHRPDPSAMFQPVTVEELTKSIFEEVAAAEAEHYKNDVFTFLTIDDLMERPDPEFLIDRHIPQNSLGFLFSDPGVGKSFLALDMALSIAAGFDKWQDERIATVNDGSVIYIASEGSFDLKMRIKAWLQQHSLKVVPKAFLVLEAAINFMEAEQIDKLIRSVEAVATHPDLIIVDTVSRALPGADENLQKDMTLFIEACDRIRSRFGCATLGLHHKSKSGAMRGSSVIEGAGDFIIEMEREKGADIGEVRMFKQKAGPDGWFYHFSLPKVFLGIRNNADGTTTNLSSLTFTKTDAPPPESVAAQYDTDAVLNELERAWLDRLPYSKEARAADRYAVMMMRAQFKIPKATAIKLLESWLATGVLVSEVPPGKEVRKAGLRVVREQPSAIFG